jgi:hypothetical protein
MKAPAHLCSECNEPHRVSPAHKEVLNKMKLTMLSVAAKHIMKTMSNNFMVRDIAQPDEFKLFNNFQKLRYHGLVTPARDDAGNRIKGRWLITRNGWGFLRGDIELPQYVIVRDNHIEERADRKVTLREVDSGAMEIVTNFFYFDENNKPVGMRPVAPIKVEQPSLFS